MSYQDVATALGIDVNSVRRRARRSGWRRQPGNDVTVRVLVPRTVLDRPKVDPGVQEKGQPLGRSAGLEALVRAQEGHIDT